MIMSVAVSHIIPVLTPKIFPVNLSFALKDGHTQGKQVPVCVKMHFTSDASQPESKTKLIQGLNKIGGLMEVWLRDKSID